MVAVNGGNEILANRDIKFVVCLRETQAHLSTRNSTRLADIARTVMERRTAFVDPCQRMSALGRNPTYAVQNVMSALPPIAPAKLQAPHMRAGLIGLLCATQMRAPHSSHWQLNEGAGGITASSTRRQMSTSRDRTSGKISCTHSLVLRSNMVPSICWSCWFDSGRLPKSGCDWRHGICDWYEYTTRR